MAMNLDDRAVHHRAFQVRLVRHRRKDPGKDVRLHPLAVALEHRVPLAEGRRQITPGAARAGNPQHRLQEQPPIHSSPAWIGRLAQAVRLHLRPLGVGQNKAVHAKLLAELESRRHRGRNPEPQQALASEDSYALPLTQAELGDTTGLSNVHVNRTLQELRRQGLIELRGGRLKILNLPRLKAIAEFKSNYLHLDRAAA